VGFENKTGTFIYKFLHPHLNLITCNDSLPQDNEYNQSLIMGSQKTRILHITEINQSFMFDIYYFKIAI